MSIGDAEALFDPHLGADALTCARIQQAATRVQADELPSIERGVVRTERRGHADHATGIVQHTVLVKNLAGGQAHRAPRPMEVTVLLAHARKAPIAEQIITILAMGLVRGLHVLASRAL